MCRQKSHCESGEVLEQLVVNARVPEVGQKARLDAAWRDLV